MIITQHPRTREQIQTDHEAEVAALKDEITELKKEVRSLKAKAKKVKEDDGV